MRWRKSSLYLPAAEAVRIGASLDVVASANVFENDVVRFFEQARRHIAARAVADTALLAAVPVGLLATNILVVTRSRQREAVYYGPNGWAIKDDYSLRQAAVANRVPYTTTLSAASAACDAIESMRTRKASVRSLQEWQGDIA